MNDQYITLKIRNLPKLNEREYFQYMYDEAMKRMLAEPTQTNIDAFGTANAKLFETEDAYRIAQRLLLERAKRFIDAVLNLDPRDSQDLHTL